MDELEKMFQEAYGQEHLSSDHVPKNVKGLRKERKITSQKYAEFLRKYDDLEKYIESFKASDLVYFFREKSKENGNYYTIRNMKRDMGIFKRLLLDYSSVEICTMIEFLFESGQKYLSTRDLQPTVLASTWCNTIFADTVKWANDEYVPDEHKTKSDISTAGRERNIKREWHSGKHTEMGVWED